eukprot:11350714-Ditylum_brightwellii.AAC.1
MEAAISAAAARFPSVTFTNFAIDEVSLDSTNHNIKSWWNQIIGGSGAANIGKLVVDIGLLQQAGVSSELIRPKDFVSDLLVKRLCSFGVIQKLTIVMDKGDAVGDVKDIEALSST